MVSRNDGLKLVVNALLSALPAMLNVILVCGLFVLIFAILGVGFFKGTFFKCNFTGIPEFPKYIYDYHDCLNNGGVWMNSPSNFDNIFFASLSLFQIMTTDGWMAIMYEGVDSVGIGLQPQPYNRELYQIYFLLFIIVGAIFIVNLFVGVVIENFN
jgi:hypothetical protein